MEKNIGKTTFYDRESDSLYIFAKKGIEESARELVPAVNLENNQVGEVIGIEILRASEFSTRLEPIGSKRSTRPRRVTSLLKEPSTPYHAKEKRR
jgi:uncharacterized protein YuzE